MKLILALGLAVVASNPALAAQSKSAPTEPPVPTVAKTNIGEEFSKLALRALFLINANQDSAPTSQEDEAVRALWSAELQLSGPDGTRRKNVNATRGEQAAAESVVVDIIGGLAAEAKSGPLRRKNCVAEIRAQLQARNVSRDVKACDITEPLIKLKGLK